MARVLVVEDERQLAELVAERLRAAGHSVALAFDGPTALTMLEERPADLVILDWMLPGLDGLEVCRRIRAVSITPILMLTARAAELDRVLGLEVGADDYLTKPFTIGELIARVRVALRHAAGNSSTDRAASRFQTGGLALDFERRRVTVDGKEVHLTPTEYEVLKYLALNVGRVITHRTLLRAVWGPAYDTEAHYLRVFVGQLRRKIEPEPSRPIYLLTVPGIGYRLAERG